jgi:hypothetical protein
MGLLGNFCGFGLAWGDYVNFATNNASRTSVFIMGISLGLYLLNFNVSH